MDPQPNPESKIENPKSMSRLLSLLLLLATSADAAVLRFRSTAQVSGGVVRVGDVADVTGGDELELSRLRAITLVPAPAEGQTLRVNYELVQNRLSAQGVNISDIEFAGRSVVTVSGSAEDKPTVSRIQRVSATSDSTVDVAQRRLSTAINEYLGRIEARLAKAAITPKLSAEQATLLARPSLRIEVGGGSAPWTGEQTFLVRVRDSRQGDRKLTVVCQVAPLSQVVYAARTVRAGQIVTAEDVMVQATAEASAEFRTLLDDPALVVGMEAQRNLRPGVPITKEDLRKAVLVQRNQPVTILSRVGTVTISMVGKADGDASLGEKVSVSTLDRKRTLTAWVTGYHEVSVTPPRSPGTEALKGKPTGENGENRAVSWKSQPKRKP